MAGGAGRLGRVAGHPHSARHHVLGQPDTGGRGKVIGNALEKSNVDLEDEFVNMITSQRTYQANARMIGTANDTLQELVQLV